MDLQTLARPRCSPTQQQVRVVDAINRREARPRRALVGNAHARDCTERGIPIRHVHVIFELRPALRPRDRTAAYEGIHADATFPIRHLPTLEGLVARGTGAEFRQVVRRTTIVAGDHHEGVFPHPLGFELTYDLAHDIIHVARHCGVLAPVRILQEAELALPGLRHLQRGMDQVETVEQEEGLIRIVAVQNAQRVLREHLFDVACPVSVARRACRVPEVHEISTNVGLVITRRQALCPIILSVVEVAEKGLIATAHRGVIPGGHACIPLASHVGTVSSRPHLLGDARHVSRDAAKAAHGILLVDENGVVEAIRHMN
mmetsp:Transcript_31014/g.78467  ORF Transcript_31014/g.78467 Transcript_31014/m.78467 type:complete len:316 (-) Transcript_31014:358-1305(-)